MPKPSVLAKALGAFFAMNVIGTLGYMALCGMSFIDALYMAVITLTTVGFREVQPLDTTGQLFTIVLLTVGLGIVLYTVSLAAREVIEGSVQQALGRRRVQRQIAGMTEHFVVCGYGRMGRMVCRELAAKPAPFVVVERDPAALRDLAEQRYTFVEGDATEDGVLMAAGIERARGLVAALSNDAENVYVVLSARELKADLLIVARAEDERSERKLLHAGATRVVSPYTIGGYRMAHALLRPAVLDVIDLATHHRNLELQIEEVIVPPRGFCDGKQLGESGFGDELGLIVIAIQKQAGEMHFNPRSETRIEAGDRLVLMGPASNLRRIEERLRA